jgi:dTDP-4-dehydrorhamnose reductase
MTQNILVTGGNGQLGQELQKIITLQKYPNYNFIFSDVDTLDITDKTQIRAFVNEYNINIVVNAAAYTAVDKAETEADLAYSINEIGASNLAEIAREFDLLLIHISTDYVFDGISVNPYKTTDAPNPLSVYGKSKLAGEIAITNSGCRSVIIRTSWLYSEFGHNFVKTIIKLSKEKKELNVVNDQIGAPTYAEDLAALILKFIEKKNDLKGCNIYHYANEGVISWYDFAVEIVKLSKSDCKINPIPAELYPSKTTRPQYSVFDLSKIKNELEIEIPDWKESLKKMF